VNCGARPRTGRHYNRLHGSSQRVSAGHQPRDRCSAEATFAAVKDRILAGRNRALSHFEQDFDTGIRDASHQAGLIGLAITYLRATGHCTLPRELGRWFTDPVHRSGDQVIAVQQLILALYDDQRIVRQVFCGNEPRRLTGTATPADTDALALPDGVEHEAFVLADRDPVLGAYRTGVRGQERSKKFPEGAFPDKTDTGAVFLLADVQSVLTGNVPDGGFL